MAAVNSRNGDRPGLMPCAPHQFFRAGYPRKDRLENHLHDLVCAGPLPLRTAQHAIAANRVEAYTRYQGQPVAAAPRPAPRSLAGTGPGRHQAPAPPATPVASDGGATARCNVGSYSYAADHPRSEPAPPRRQKPSSSSPRPPRRGGAGPPAYQAQALPRAEAPYLFRTVGPSRMGWTDRMNSVRQAWEVFS